MKFLFGFTMLLIVSGVVKGGKFGFHLCMPCSGTTTSHNLWYLQALNDNFSSLAFCHAMSLTDPKTRGGYQMMVDQNAVHGCTTLKECSHPGILFNAQDEFNYDLVFFRGHSTSHCYEHGYVKNGKYFSVKTGSCRHGNPKMHSWLSIKLRVFQQKASATLYLNGGWVADIKPHFPATRWCGALTINNHMDVILFRNYKMIPQ